MTKRFLIILILIFNLSNFSFADDIRDFQIEGMSVGDSLLDHFSKKEVKDFFEIVNEVNYYPKSKKFALSSHDIKNSEVYEGIRFHYKTKDKKFIIHALSGMNSYANNGEACYTKEKEIIKELESESHYCYTYSNLTKVHIF